MTTLALIADADAQGDDDPTLLEHGSLSFFAIRRGDRLAVRVKDSEAAALKTFTVSSISLSTAWRVEARFEAATAHADPSPERARLRRDDRLARPRRVLGRRRRAPPAGARRHRRRPALPRLRRPDQRPRDLRRRPLPLHRPARRRATIDFNRAYNPPCVFSPYATCPLPPPDNRLPLAVEAGEKKYAGPPIRDDGGLYESVLAAGGGELPPETAAPRPRSSSGGRAGRGSSSSGSGAATSAVHGRLARLSGRRDRSRRRRAAAARPRRGHPRAPPTRRRGGLARRARSRARRRRGACGSCSRRPGLIAAHRREAARSASRTRCARDLGSDRQDPERLRRITAAAGATRFRSRPASARRRPPHPARRREVARPLARGQAASRSTLAACASPGAGSLPPFSPVRFDNRFFLLDGAPRTVSRGSRRRRARGRVDRSARALGAPRRGPRARRAADRPPAPSARRGASRGRRAAPARHRGGEPRAAAPHRAARRHRALAARRGYPAAAAHTNAFLVGTGGVRARRSGSPSQRRTSACSRRRRSRRRGSVARCSDLAHPSPSGSCRWRRGGSRRSGTGLRPSAQRAERLRARGITARRLAPRRRRVHAGAVSAVRAQGPPTPGRTGGHLCFEVEATGDLIAVTWSPASARSSSIRPRRHRSYRCGSTACASSRHERSS